MSEHDPQPLTTYLELRASRPDGEEGAGLSHAGGGLVLLHVLELAAHGEPRGGVTLVHDAGDHGGRYVEAARSFASHGWAVALPDMRGHGRSEGERGHSAGLKEVLRDLDQVQQHLAYRLPTAPKVLVGSGLGALYALAYVLERPGQSEALVMLSPRWQPGFEPPKPTGLFKAFRKSGPTTPGRVGNDPAALTSDPLEQQAWRDDPLVHDVITARAAEQAAEIAAACAAGVGKAGVPVLVLHGASDRLADPEASRRAAGPGVEVRVLDDMAHDLLHERERERVLAQVRAWIDATVR